MDIIQEVSQNFIDSAYDTNVNRAFPDARDGLKPGQRACLWTMYKKGHTSDKPHVKSAKIDGEVAAAIWPHGTTAIYETFARMSQPFTNNAPEVDFHGANGNVILGGGAIAADRYSEARLSRMTEKYMLEGCDKNAVDMQLNFSEDEWWPVVLPSIFPRLLVNGSQGIGVSIANSWCLHGLTETAEVLERYIQTGEVDNESYLPDWPCGATIVNKDELAAINETGKGKIVTEAKYEISGKEIRFTEFPFQVYIEPLVEEIKSAIEADKVHDVSEVFNKSDKRQVLLTVTCTSATKAPQVLEELMSNTSLRSQFNVNQVAIVGKTPKLLTLKDMCKIYVAHNLSCIKREHQFDLDKTLARIEVLEGLAKALNDIDGLVRLIKNSESGAEARSKLEGYGFTTPQIDAILNMRLTRLAHLEVSQVLAELEEKRGLATSLKTVVDSESEQKKVLVKRLRALVAEFGDSRRTKVIQKDITKAKAERVKKEKVVEDTMLCLDLLGYMKSVPLPKFRTSDSNVREKKAKTDSMMVFLSNAGRAYRLKANSVKQCLNSEKGTALGSILSLAPGETICDFFVTGEDAMVLVATAHGYVKRLEAKTLVGSTQDKAGKSLIGLHEGDCVACCMRCDKASVVILKSALGSLAIPADSIPTSGRASKGKVGAKVRDGEVIDAAICATSLPDGMTIGKCGQRTKK